MDSNTFDANDPNNQLPGTRRTLSRRVVLGTLGSVGLGAIAGCVGSSKQETDFISNEDEKELQDAASAYLSTATLYKAPNCTCCLKYAEYLEKTTDAEIESEEVDDLAVIKEEYGVPKDVESCHTMDTESYFVEGHVPREAIGKMALEEPDIAGIALPDMPLGSPGMPGEKTEEFVIYAVKEDGSSHEFMRL